MPEKKTYIFELLKGEDLQDWLNAKVAEGYVLEWVRMVPSRGDMPLTFAVLMKLAED